MNKLKLGKVNSEIIWLIVIVLTFTLVVFRKYIFLNLVPIPGDILTGLYYPWFDYKWGYVTPVPVKNSLPSDVISILYPWRIIGMRLIKNGLLPLWDSTILFGTPLLANFQSSILNPFNVFFLFLSELDSWSIQVVLQPILMVVSTYIFLRDLKLSKYASVFGGILYAFSGYSIVWMEYNSINYTLAYFPLLLLFCRKILKNPNLKWVFLLSITLSFQLLSGYPLNVAFSLFGLVLYYFFLQPDLRRFTLKKVVFLTLGLLSGFAMSAIQLLPSLELYKNTSVIYDTVAISGRIKYLPLNHLITLFFPNFYGNPATGNYWSIGSYDNFAFCISSVGIFFLLFLLFSGKISFKKHLYFLILAAISLIIATENPFTLFITDNNLVGFNSNVNTRIMFLFSFSISVLASFGLEKYLKDNDRLWKRILPLVTYAAMVSYFTLLFIIMNYQNGLNWVESILGNNNTFNQEIINIVVVLRNSFIPLLTVMLVFLFTFVRNKKVFIYLTLVLLIFSVFKSTDKYLSFTRRDLMYPNVELIDYLQEVANSSRFEKERGNLLMPSNSWSLYGLGAATGQNVSTLLTTGNYLSIINSGKIENTSLNRFNEIRENRSPLINTLNISHYLFMKWDDNKSPSANGVVSEILIPDNFKYIKDIGSVSIYENPNNLGNAWFPKNIFCESDIKYISDLISNSNYDAGEAVYVNCPKNMNLNEIEGSVDLIDKDSGIYTFETESKTGGYLTVSEAYFPGWESKIDGQKFEPVNSANEALIATYIPKGRHFVELKYKPKSFYIGAIISVSCIIVWTIIFFIKHGIRIKKVDI